MGRFLVERHESRQEILLHLDDVQLQVKLLDHKLNMMAEKIVGLDLANLDYPQPQVPVVKGCPIT
jgi:hypothetical protein